MTPSEIYQNNKRYLKQYRPFKRQIDRLQQQLYELECQMENVGSMNMDGMPKGGTVQRDLSNGIDKHSELIDRIDGLVKEALPVRREILASIDHLENPNQSQVLEMYFIGDMPLEVIAEHLGYSLRQTRRFHGDGIKAIKIMGPYAVTDPPTWDTNGIQYRPAPDSVFDKPHA